MFEWLRLRLLALLRKDEVECELDEELRSHLERGIEQMTSVALLACYIPARRATKVDPLVALHCE